MSTTTTPTDRRTPELDALDGLVRLSGYPFQILTYVDAEGYPVNVAVEAAIDPDGRSATFAAPAGLYVPQDRPVGLTGSHIRPQPGYGYDERRHVTVWGSVATGADGGMTLAADRAWGWDEAETPFFEYSERSVGQSRRYFDAMSAERGTPVRPRLSLGWLTLRTTRLPFLSATIVPVVLGIAIAASERSFDWLTALLTVIGAACVQLGLNVANDYFDSAEGGADELNVTPTQFSGGSRVILYGLVSMRRMAWLAAGFFAGAIVLGLWMAVARGFWPLFWIGLAGVLIGVEYTAPPLRLVHRGLGEIAVAAGFGPIMVLGAFFVQAQHLSWEAFYASLPVAILIALVLYANEIPDRPGDAASGKRTLPVRLSKRAIVGGYRASTATTFALIAIGAVTLLLPVWSLAALITIPMAIGIARALDRYYDSPYELMAHLGTNVQLHLYTGLLLVGAYVVADLIAHLAPSASAWLR
jgi:1,4-dihydroxy-2-naphthoate octaprenyltransferase